MIGKPSNIMGDVTDADWARWRDKWDADRARYIELTKKMARPHASKKK